MNAISKVTALGVRKYTCLGDDDYAEIRSMFAAGKTRKEIAEWMGLTYKYVCDIVRGDKGIPRENQAKRGPKATGRACVYVACWVPSESRAELQDIAGSRGITVSAVLREAVMMYLEGASK